MESETHIQETNKVRIRVRDTDLGRRLVSWINELQALLDAYHSGLIKER